MLKKLKINKLNMPNLKKLFVPEKKNLKDDFLRALNDEQKKIRSIKFVIVWGEIYALHAENSKHEVLVKPSSQDVNHVAERVGDTVWFSADATITGNETKKGTLLFLIGDIQAMVANGQIVIREFS